MDDLAGLIGLLLLAALVFWVVRALLSDGLKKWRDGWVVVMEHEAGLKFRNGIYQELLRAGRYATWPAPIKIQKIDLRLTSFSVAGQEVLTADKMQIRLGAVVSYRVVEPKAFHLAAAAPANRLYDCVQIALRRRVAVRNLDDILADRAAVEEGLAAEVEGEIAALGVKVESVALRDITLVGAAKQAFADLWKAQKEGLAALERARGEQAALRSLANSARLLKNNPELMNLRLLHALQGAPGRAPPTIVLGGAGGIIPPSQAGAGDSASAAEPEHD